MLDRNHPARQTRLGLGVVGATSFLAMVWVISDASESATSIDLAASLGANPPTTAASQQGLSLSGGATPVLPVPSSEGASQGTSEGTSQGDGGTTATTSAGATAPDATAPPETAPPETAVSTVATSAPLAESTSAPTTALPQTTQPPTTQPPPTQPQTTQPSTTTTSTGS